MKKQFFAAAMILALGAGFTACSSDDLNVKEQKEVKNGKEATTYMSYTFTVPTPGTRAAATNDGQGDTQPANNYIKDYKGVDKIAKVSAYVFNGEEGSATLEAKQTLTGTTDFDFVQDQAGKTVIKPKKAIKVTVGKKTVFLVVNPSADVETLLGSANTLADFKTAYNSASLGFTGRSAVNATNTGLDISTTNPFKTAADVIANLDAAGSTILMTGAPVAQDVAENVTEANTVLDSNYGTTTNNRFNFTLKRAVATVSVSTKAASYDIKGDDPTQDGVQNVTIATIANLTFSEAQGEQKLYFSQQAADAADNTAYKTPAYGFVPATATDYASAKDKYEYNGLWRTNTTVTNNTKGIAVATHADGALTTTSADAYVAANLGVAFLPATHKWTESGDNYKEGNTPYVLVRGYITPKFVYKLNAAGDGVERDAAWAGASVYYGADGKFYATNEAAQKAAEKALGAGKTQTVKFFKNRMVLYTVWINPDNATGKNWKNSPTSRNNIYHISINNIKTIGESWNPLVPGDFPNPDPKPTPTESPNEGSNRHDPTKPLSPVETWMSVDATIVPWAIHSYGVDL